MGTRDKFIWPHTKDGEYSVKTGYHMAFSSSQAPTNFPSISTVLSSSFWNQFWNIKTVQKIKLFLWRICHNAVPVKENLLKRRIASSSVCSICNSDIETVEHALLLCPWTKPVWFGSQLQLAPSVNNVTWIDLWLQQLFETLGKQPDYKEHGLSMLAHTLWMIWKGRNSSAFNQQDPNLPSIFIEPLLWQKSFSKPIVKALPGLLAGDLILWLLVGIPLW